MFISTCQFFKDNKLHKPVGQVQFVVFEKFTSAYYTKLQENTYYYLLTIYRKNITESQHRQNFESVHMLFVILHSSYNFALVLYENALVFSQSEALNFFMYITIIVIFNPVLPVTYHLLLNMEPLWHTVC